jgi:Chitin synthase export chaperone
MILCAIAIAVTIYLFLVTERRKAAVGMILAIRQLTIGRREMEIVLFGYFLINICQIFSLGGFLTNTTVVQVRVSVL